MALRGAVRCRTGAPVFSAQPGSRFLTKHSSLPGLTRQSIPFVRLLRIAMDTRAFASPKGLRPRRRVKPAYDAQYVAASSLISDSIFKRLRFRILAARIASEVCQSLANLCEGGGAAGG